MGKILIADDNPHDRELLGSWLTGEGYEICYAETGAQTLKQASQNIPDLVLLDVSMPDIDGLDVCRHLRLDPLLAEVPIILITGKDHHEAYLTGLEAGADDVLFKPLDMIEIPTRVRNIVQLNRYRKLVNERAANELARVERETSYESVLVGWARALELRGVEPEGNIHRVIQMTLRLARARNVPTDTFASIRWGVLLHDSGKSGVSDSIFAKNHTLSAKERAALRKHPEHAYDLFCGTDAMQTAIDIPYCHHERWDGTGYPRGLKGEEIPLAARIFAVADAWDILTSPPPLRQGVVQGFRAAADRRAGGQALRPERGQGLRVHPDGGGHD